MNWEITTPASGRAVDLDVVNRHLRLDDQYDDAELNQMIDAATEFAEDSMGCSLVHRTITATYFDSDPMPVDGRFRLPRGPVTSIVSVTADGAAVSDYRVERVGNSDLLWVRSGLKMPLVIVYGAGYSTLPPSIRLAILQHVATLHENRESVSDKAKVVVPHSLADFYRLKRRSPGVA